MPFTVDRYVADPAGNIVALQWTYSNADGSLSNTLDLAQPAGDIPRDNVTEDVLVTWLEAQLGNTAEEFDAAIANAKKQHEFQASLQEYVEQPDGTFEVVKPPEEVAPAPVKEAAGSKSRSR